MKKATPLLNHDDYLTFVASLDSVYESDSDSDSDNDCDYTDEQNGAYQNNLVVEHENLIKKYLKIMIFFMPTKLRLNCLMKKGLVALKIFDFSSLNIILFLREIMFSF